MPQEFISNNKILLAFFALFFLSAPLAAQNVTQDTTATIDVENPMNVSPQQFNILGIKVVGLTTSRKTFVIETSGLEKDSKITIPGEDISKAIKNLYHTGLFTNIQIKETGREAGGIYLKIIVDEQPRLEGYKIHGVKKSEREDLHKKLNLLQGYAVTNSAIAQAKNTIKRFYKKKGHWGITTTVEKSKVDTVRNLVSLDFHIDAGERLEIKDITFSGNKKFGEKMLRKSLSSIKEDRWYKFFSKKLFKQEDFGKAKDNLRKFYGAHGYLDFRILSDTVYTFPYTQHRLLFFHKKARGIKVHFKVKEGNQYKVRNVNWEGNTVYSDKTLTKVLGFKKGEIFNQKKFQKNLTFTQGGSDVTSLYQNIGYLFSHIQPHVDAVGKDSVDLNISVYEGKIATINKVSFDGNTKTHDDVVRRSLRTVPGQKYSRQAIIRSVRELGQLGYFRKKSIKPDLSPDRENQTVDINYSLDESQSTDNFEFSGGFGGRGIGVILSAKLNFNNFSLQRAIHGKGWNPVPSGDGQKLSLGLQVTGGGYQSYNVGFQEPWLSGRPISLGVNLGYDLISYRGSDSHSKLLSSSVSIGRRLKWPDDYFTHKNILSYQLYDVAGGTSFLAQGTSSIISLKEVLLRNSTDSPISPTTGSKLKLSGEIAPPLPGFSQYYKLRAMYQNHTTITGKFVLTNTVSYGYLGYIGDLRRSNYQRFVLGGTKLQQRQSFLQDNIDLRGFPGGRGQSISPVKNGQAVGGRLFTKYSMELRYPAVTSKSAQVYPYLFMDAGNAYLDVQQFQPFDLKRAVGVGARVYLPILGLVDLSYGYRLDGVTQTQGRVGPGEWQFLFNIGTPF